MNDAPVITTLAPLVVTEGNSPLARQITTRLLSATDPDTAPGSMVYTVVTGPTNGTLRVGAAVASLFTQADLAAGRVTYTHNGSETTSDSFVFQLSDGDTNTVQPLPGTFSISVLPINDAPVLQTTNPELLIPAGTPRVIALTVNQLSATDVDTLPTQLVYTLLSNPDVALGSLLKSGSTVPLAAGSSFTQADLTSGTIVYNYTGQPGGSDSILLQLSDGTTSFIVTLNISLT